MPFPDSKAFESGPSLHDIHIGQKVELKQGKKIVVGKVASISVKGEEIQSVTLNSHDGGVVHLDKKDGPIIPLYS
ncbi:MAG: hypothetical protein Q7R74_00350 [bacterium]|nr:hypothetical protein [bacterium]